MNCTFIWGHLSRTVTQFLFDIISSFFAKFKNVVHSLEPGELLGVSPGSKLCTTFFSLAKHDEKMSNKNWVTVRDKCPQINVQFKWNTFLKKKNSERTPDGRTDGQTNGRSDYIMPQILFGGIKINLQELQRNRKLCQFNKDQYCTS